MSVPNDQTLVAPELQLSILGEASAPTQSVSTTGSGFVYSWTVTTGTFANGQTLDVVSQGVTDQNLILPSTDSSVGALNLGFGAVIFQK